MTYLEQTTEAISVAPVVTEPVAPPASLGRSGSPSFGGATAELSVVVVDSHAAVRAGMPFVLSPERIGVVASAGSGEHAEALIAQHEPDVALVSTDLPDLDGIVLLQRLVRRGVRTAVVLYADEDDAQQAALAVHAGAAGIVAKRRTVAELATALRTVAGGGVWFRDGGSGSEPAPELSRPALVLSPGTERRTDALSGSELRVLALVAEGASTEEMAEQLSLSPHTVRTHLRNVMRKLEASSRAHAVAIAIRERAIKV